MAEEEAAADRGAGEPTLRRELTTFSLTTLIIGAIIGSGIFFLPAAMLGQAGGAWPVMLAWVLGAIVAMSGGLAFAELGAAFPKAGGQYAFLRDSLGKGWAFQFAWSCFAVVQSGTIAAVAVALAGAVDYLVDLPGSNPCLGAGTSSDCDGLVLPKWGVGFLAVAIIAILTFVNQLGVRRGSWINNAAGLAKTGALLAIAGLAFALGRGAGNFDGPATAFGAMTLSGFGLALANSLFAYDGFSQATFVAAEVKDARRALPRAIVLGTAIVAAIYLLATFAFFHVLPEAEVSQEARDGAFPIAAESMDYLLGGGAATLVVLAVVISTFGTVNTYVLTSPRIYHPIARDGGFPRPFGRLNRHGTPVYGLWYGAIWASLLTMTGGYVALANLVVFGLYVFYLATMVGYFVLRRKDPGAFEAAGFRMPLRPLPVVFFLLASIAVLVSYLAADVPLLLDGRLGGFLASTTGMGILLLGLGIVLYAFQRKVPTSVPSSP
ncbi:MAG TPA: APC family permease [Candidatus Thermoplasmatota archaeon]|nr:APC family permease [Candidatus Thermoplasmatota archaeon]